MRQWSLISTWEKKGMSRTAGSLRVVSGRRRRNVWFRERLSPPVDGDPRTTNRLRLSTTSYGIGRRIVLRVNVCALTDGFEEEDGGGGGGVEGIDEAGFHGDRDGVGV